jgi:hypothetical protein
MTKTIRDLSRGETFRFSGYYWIALGDVQGGDKGRICLMADVLTERLPFSSKGSNAWETSTIRAKLNGSVYNDLAYFAFHKSDALLSYITDTCDKVFLLSKDEYTRNRDVIPNVSVPWWLRSPDAGYSTTAGIVYTDGRVDYITVGNYFAARPAIYLALDTEVVVTDPPAEDDKISIELSRADWVALAKLLLVNIRRMSDDTFAQNLLREVEAKGIKPEALNENA